MSDGYRRQRQWYGDYGGGLLVGALVGQTTLITGKLLYTVFVQRIHIHITGAKAGTTWDVQDGTTGVSLIGPLSTAQTVTTVGDLQSIPTQDPIAAEYDYGPFGIAIAQGSSLVFVPSSTGATGVITWDAYQRHTGIMNVSNMGGNPQQAADPATNSNAGPGGGIGQPPTIPQS